MSAVVASIQQAVSAAGVEMLQKGGNIVDAAVAAGFAECVVSPSLVSIGGVANIHIYDAPTRSHYLIEGGGPAGSNAHADTFAGDYVGRRDLVGRWEVRGFANQMGYRSIAVPSFVGVMGEAHALLGTLRWEDLLQPAIRLARDGFIFNEYARRFWTEDGEAAVVPEADPVTKLNVTDECRRLMLTPEGRLHDVGDRIVMSDLSTTLSRLAHCGAAEFYRGDLAKEIAQDIAANGGLFTLDDLRAFRPRLSHEPYRGVYRNFELVTPRLPSANLEMITLLQVLGDLDVGALEWNGAEYIDLVARVLHEVFQDRLRYYADPEFHAVPVDWLASVEHANDLRNRVLAGEAATDRIDVPRGSSYYCLADEAGSAVACSHSWGSGSGVATPGLGFVYNNMMGLFDPRPGHNESIAPGKRGVSGSGALMLFDEGRLRLVTGSPAGPRGTTAVLQCLLNHYVFGMSLEEAVAKPRFHTEEPGVIYVEGEHFAGVEASLQERGYRVTRWRYGGRVPVIALDDAGRLDGAIDPRSAGEIGVWP